MNVQALRYLLAVTEEGHFGRAAARMHVAQSSLSQSIARLEQQFGTRLLDRTGHGIVPTEAGERVLDSLRPALHHIDRALAAAAGGAPLRVGCTPFASTWVAAHVLTPFRRAHPDLDVSVAELPVPAQARALATGEIDAAVGEPLVPDPGLRETLVREDPCAVWLGRDHPLAGQGAVALADLEGVTLADGDPAVYPAYAAWLRATFAEAGVTPSFGAPLTDTSSAISRIIDGSIVSLSCDMLPAGAVPGLVVRPVSDPVRWRWVVTTRRDGVPVAARRLVGWFAR